MPFFNLAMDEIVTAADNLRWAAALPPGWSRLITEMVDAIAEQDPDATVRQAKQKFGTLRVYLDRYTLETEALVDAASVRSGITCERCGRAAELRMQPEGYLETLCKQHIAIASKVPADLQIASIRFHSHGRVKQVNRRGPDVSL